MPEVIIVILTMFPSRGWRHDMPIPFFPDSERMGFNTCQIFYVFEIKIIHLFTNQICILPIKF
jgi:hypothetical protein